MRVIINSKKKKFINFKELVRYKDLFFTLTWRDFRVRYAQTTIGFLWAIIQPLLTLLILYLVFGKFIGVNTKIPHLVFTMSGISIWSYFSFVMTNSGNSIISSQNMVKKIYFPKIIIPLSKAMVGFIDFGISIFLLVVLMIYYGVEFSNNLYFAPIFILFGIIAALAVGIWLSALSVRYRDFQYIVPFFVQIGLYITPVAYPASFATEKLPSWAQKLYFLNPMAGVVQGFRWSVFGGESPGSLVVLSFLMIIFLFISGIFYFGFIEDEIADFV
tara:strand:+ start:557 stop:1375 length:819 start_codon:yes stop_codon:yes gene_type:complete